MSMIFKNHIKTLMDRGWRQEQIADHCRTCQSSISGLHRGVTKEPRYTLALAILQMVESEITPPVKNAGEAT
jgi:transcriptional regulator